MISEIDVTWEEKLRKAEKIQEERQASLEKMGISVETSGIKVEHSKFYLVNLNADPSLNELLVYYLKVNLSVYLQGYLKVNLRLLLEVHLTVLKYIS